MVAGRQAYEVSGEEKSKQALAPKETGLKSKSRL